MKLNPKEAPKGYVARETRETYGCASCAPKRPRRTAAPEGKDICSRCGRVQTYGTMKAVSEDSFDLLCTKCRRPRSKAAFARWWKRQPSDWRAAMRVFGGDSVEALARRAWNAGRRSKGTK